MATTVSNTNEQPLKIVATGTVLIAYVEHGSSNGWPIILSHGFPYDVHAFDEVASILIQSGARVIAPYTRGFGSTRGSIGEVTRTAWQQQSC